MSVYLLFVAFLFLLYIMKVLVHGRIDLKEHFKDSSPQMFEAVF